MSENSFRESPLDGENIAHELRTSVLTHFDERRGKCRISNFDEPCSVCGKYPSVGETQLCGECLGH
jgi:hypothetical protein